jgi:hypothetical protein
MQRVELMFSCTCNDSSSWKTVKSGVPQGSVLGPLLFNIYINDFLGLFDNNSNEIMYADDTSILISNNSYEELYRILNDILYNTIRWFQVNQMVFNMEKTKIIKFTPANPSHSSLGITSGENLPVITNVLNFLGLLLASQLSWKPHIHFLLHKLSSVCFIMGRLSPILNIQTLRTVYFAHFHFLVNYGIIFCGNTSSVRKVFLIQKKVLRIMLRLSSWSSCRK